MIVNFFLNQYENKNYMRAFFKTIYFAKNPTNKATSFCISLLDDSSAEKILYVRKKDKGINHEMTNKVIENKFWKK